MLLKRLYVLLFVCCSGLVLKSQAPTATIVVPSGTFCTGSAYTFSSITSPTISAYSWSIIPSGGVEFPEGIASATTSIRFKNAGTYSVSLFVANASGTFTTGTLFSVNKSAMASYNASLTESGFPVDLVLTNFSTDANSFNWNFSGAIPTQTITNVVQTFSTSGSHSVSLIAFGNNGCNDTLDYNFVIDDISEVILPNVFTPNNDGVNDVFKPRAKGVTEMKFWIYNRFGTIMYESAGKKAWWDGYTTSGIACPAGVYFVIVEAKGFDGKDYKLNGTLTLIK